MERSLTPQEKSYAAFGLRCAISLAGYKLARVNGKVSPGRALLFLFAVCAATGIAAEANKK